MTIKEKVFKWFDEHPEELAKTGYGSNSNLREAFPNESRKTLSMYKMKYKKAKKELTESASEQPEATAQSPAEAKETKEEPEVTEEEKEYSVKLDSSNSIFLFLIPIVLLLLWWIFKPNKK